MLTEQFSIGESFIHHLDPRIKVFIIILFSLVVALTQKFIVLFPALGFAIFLLIIARVPKKKAARRLLIVNSFILFLWLFLPFSHADGNSLFTLSGINISESGVLLALFITLKSNAIIIASLALLGTCSLFAIIHALRHFYLPDKLVNLIFFCCRYINVLHQEYNRMRNMLKVRNFYPRTNPHTYKTFAYLVGMLIINSYNRSQRVFQAMLCRGFKGEFWMLEHFTLKKSDVVYGSLFFIYILGLILLQWNIIIPL